MLYLIPVRSTVRLRQQGEEEEKELLSPAGLLSEADPKHLFQFLPTLLDLEEARGVRQGLGRALSLSEDRLLLYKQSLLPSFSLPAAISAQRSTPPAQHRTHLGEDVSAHSLLCPGLLVELSSPLLLRVPDHICYDLSEAKRKGEEGEHYGWVLLSLPASRPALPSHFTLRSLLCDLIHSWMKSCGLLLKLSMKSRCVFSWLMDSMVSWICRGDRR